MSLHVVPAHYARWKRSISLVKRASEMTTTPISQTSPTPPFNPATASNEHQIFNKFQRPVGRNDIIRLSLPGAAPTEAQQSHRPTGSFLARGE